MVAFVSGFGIAGGRGGAACAERKGASAMARVAGDRRASLMRMSMVKLDSIYDKSYQLEELEDKEHTTTALYLNRDGSVDCGTTTGPVPKESSGEWKMDSTSSKFMMKLTRVFEQEKGDYSITRVYEGELSKKENAYLNFEGKLVMDNFPVGFFKMISTTDDLPEEHFKAV